ncbi:MAG TPA: MBL fold metallo-hydrolase [Gemmatimonadales bacterium]|nr:MBL fold metallo-hydrolase [Gemmatimonadales bacterium]
MRLTVGFIAVLLAPPLAAQQNWDSVRIAVTPVGPGVHMLTGRGGNLGVSSGPDGVFVIDDQYAPLTGKITAAIRTVSDGPIRFVLNTHWHGDHTGGNENFGKAGALLVAHDNVRARMSVEQFIERVSQRVPPSPAGALPVVTFTQAVTFHLNGDELFVFHVPQAHTDGDAIIHFRRANVIHMGDTFMNAMYPFIDLSSGGNVLGIIAAADTALSLANDSTRIIPGHGRLATRADLRAFRDVVAGTLERVRAARAAGRSLDEVKAAGLTQAWDAAFGGGFIRPDAFVESVYRSLERR